MPKKRRADPAALVIAIRARLLSGSASAAELYQPLGISQATFSRVVSRNSAELLISGRGAATRYALRRSIPGVGPAVPLFQVDSAGKTARFGELHAVHPRGFYFRSADEGRRPSRFFPDLPYFLDDLRPSGFLGRLVPRRHPELGAPKSITDWTADDCLRYLTRYGADLVGDLILGDSAFRRYLDEATREAAAIAAADRETEFPKRAREVLEYGDPGSSAGGEQPKFAARVGPERLPVLVKFSPKADNDVARRRSDLLISEHLALEALGRSGKAAAKSELVFGGGQTFLQVERFDRVPPRGRRGLISLSALDAEFAGHGRDWGESAGRLLEAGRIDAQAREQTRWRELFGGLIGNTDMHQANLSFFFDAPKVLGLAPAYDMLPMLYAPQNEQLIEREFRPPRPGPWDAPSWESALQAAAEFWEAVGNDERVSGGFRAVARENRGRVEALGRLKDLLP